MYDYICHVLRIYLSLEVYLHFHPSAYLNWDRNCQTMVNTKETEKKLLNNAKMFSRSHEVENCFVDEEIA